MLNPLHVFYQPPNPSALATTSLFSVSMSLFVYLCLFIYFIV